MGKPAYSDLREAGETIAGTYYTVVSVGENTGGLVLIMKLAARIPDMS
jgi:type II secretory pathway component PulF